MPRFAWTPLQAIVAAVLVMLLIGAVPAVKMSLVVNGLFLASIIALGAIGLTLIFGILNFANVAHGDYMTTGAYLAFFIIQTLLAPVGIEGRGLGPFTFGYPLLIALPAAAALVAAGVIGLDVLVYRKLRTRGANAAVLAMVSLGIAIALRGLVRIIWSGDAQNFPRESRQFFHLPLDVRVPPDSIFIAIVAILLVIGVHLLLTRTKMGKAMRAYADNPNLALVTGINTERVIWATWAIGGAMAATAGILLAVSQGNLLPIMGWKFLIPLFAAVILGGIGNPYGALLGALLVGTASEVSTQWLNPSYKPVISFAIMIGVLLLRPRGIFGASR